MNILTEYQKRQIQGAQDRAVAAIIAYFALLIVINPPKDPQVRSDLIEISQMLLILIPEQDAPFAHDYGEVLRDAGLDGVGGEWI